MKKLTPFEYWVQRTLPQVYDDSMSFYELLNKVVHFLNEVIESQNEVTEEVENLLNWFNNLDVQEEVNSKLDGMVLDGTLDTIINQNIFNDINSRLLQNALLPKKLEVETDYTGALTRAFNEVKENGVIHIPQGEVFTFTEATLTKKNVKFRGGGQLRGKLIIDYVDSNASGIVLDGLNVSSEIGIEVRSARLLKIINSNFEGCDKAIHLNPRHDAPLHAIGMVIINGNTFNDNNYDVYVSKPAGALRDWLVNDVILTSNQMNLTKMYNFYAEEIDGLYMSDNFGLMPSGSITKVNNVFIKKADWVQINDNHLSEAGYESINIEFVNHAVINGNQISWCGQLTPSSGVKIGTIAETTVNRIHATVNSNVISKPTKHGVEFLNVARFQSKNNVIEIDHNNNSNYKGAQSLNFTHYGVFIDGNNGDVEPYEFEVDNLCVAVDEDLNSKFRQNMKSSYLGYKYRGDITGTQTTLEGGKFDYFSLAQPSTTTITSLGSAPTGKEITLTAFNGNTAIAKSSSIRLNGEESVNIPQYGVITFKIASGVWYEKSRSFGTAKRSKDFTVDTTTLDVSKGVEHINLVIPTNNTIITSITGGYNTQEITIVSFNNNATIGHNSNINLKDGVNAFIPSNRAIKLTYWAGKWYEVSRGF